LSISAPLVRKIRDTSPDTGTAVAGGYPLRRSKSKFLERKILQWDVFVLRGQMHNTYAHENATTASDSFARSRGSEIGWMRSKSKRTISLKVWRVMSDAGSV